MSNARSLSRTRSVSAGCVLGAAVGAAVASCCELALRAPCTPRSSSVSSRRSTTTPSSCPSCAVAPRRFLEQIVAGADPKGAPGAHQALYEQLLKELVDDQLIEQTARKMNVTVSSSDVEQAIENVRKQNSLDEARFWEAVKGQGFTEKQYRTDVRKQILRLKVTNQRVRSRVSDRTMTRSKKSTTTACAKHAAASVFTPSMCSSACPRLRRPPKWPAHSRPRRRVRGDAEARELCGGHARARRRRSRLARSR